MKKFKYIILCCSLIIFAYLFININVTTQQCVNYHCRSITIPLYLKILDFFDRHYNYKQLVSQIIKDAKNGQEKVMKIFTWTHENIRQIPVGMPVMDDHVWYTIVRGYGSDDQFQDVFSTLCNYAGIDAFFTYLYTEDKSKLMVVSFVNLRGKWSLFDVYRGVYFKNREGGLASIEDLLVGDWQISTIINHEIPDYAAYFHDLKDTNLKNWKLTRSVTQSPLRRFILWIKRGNKGKNFN